MRKAFANWVPTLIASGQRSKSAKCDVEHSRFQRLPNDFRDRLAPGSHLIEVKGCSGLNLFHILDMEITPEGVIVLFQGRHIEDCL